MNPYREAMKNIYLDVAMKQIRKLVRTPGKDAEKMAAIIEIVHDYEEDVYQAERIEEERLLKEDEEKMRKERINDMFEGMAEPVNQLMDMTKGGSK